MFDPRQLESLRRILAEWQQTTLNETLAAVPERQKDFRTTSSEVINRLYTPLDVADQDYEQDLGLPGEYPIHPRRTPHAAPRQAVDHADVRRLWHGRGNERPLQVPA